MKLQDTENLKNLMQMISDNNYDLKFTDIRLHYNDIGIWRWNLPLICRYDKQIMEEIEKYYPHVLIIKYEKYGDWDKIIEEALKSIE